MGAMQNQERVPGQKKKGRGSVRNNDRLAAFAERGPSDGGDWSACGAEEIKSVVTAITALGGAVTFGMSRDMGAHSVTLMLDGKRQPLWFNGDADLTEELHKVKEVLASYD